MGFKDRLDRLKSTRVGKPSKFEKKEHEENAEKYSNKKFHHKHNANKPKSQSIREQVITKVMAKGRDLQEKSKQHAIDELKKSKSKKSKTKKSKPESKEPTPDSSNNFDFGFGNQSNEQFGFGEMFTPRKQEEKPQQQDVDWSKVFNFRMDSDSKRRKYNPYGSYDF